MFIVTEGIFKFLISFSMVSLKNSCLKHYSLDITYYVPNLAILTLMNNFFIN